MSGFDEINLDYSTAHDLIKNDGRDDPAKKHSSVFKKGLRIMDAIIKG